MIKVVLSYIHYPMALAKYFEFALRRRDDVELFTVGPYTGTWIPWNDGMHLPQKYAKAPDLALPQEALNFVTMLPDIVYPNLPWEPDLWLQVDANFRFAPKPKAKVVAHVATDPHVIDYTIGRKNSDFFFNMQTPYMQEGDIYLPYAFDPTIHKPLEIEKEYDAVLLGLHYQERNALVARLRQKGYTVLYDLGKVYEEYNELNNKARIGLNWSSKQDLVARVWELAGSAIPIVTNDVPDLNRFFMGAEDYLGFNSLEGAVFQVQRLMSDEELREKIRWNAYNKVKDDHTWDKRIEQIFEECGLI